MCQHRSADPIIRSSVNPAGSVCDAFVIDVDSVASVAGPAGRQFFTTLPVSVVKLPVTQRRVEIFTARRFSAFAARTGGSFIASAIVCAGENALQKWDVAAGLPLQRRLVAGCDGDALPHAHLPTRGARFDDRRVVSISIAR